MTTGARPPPGAVTPERIYQMSWGFAATRALGTALEIDLFTKIAEGQRTEEALRAATGASARGLRPILDAMVGFGLVARRGKGSTAQHDLAPDAALFLVRTSPAYQGDFLRFHAGTLVRSWEGLTEAVRTGEPVTALDRPEEGVPFWHQLVDTLFAVNHAAGRRLGEELSRLHPKGPVRVLDVASGSGVWGLSIAQVEPRVRVTSFDLAETLDHARRSTARLGLGPRVEFLAGDLRTTDLGERRYEAAVLGHICHSEGAEHSKALLAKVARALVPGGTIALAEFVPEDDRSGPPMPLIFALNMLVLTREGDAYTFEEYASWLEDAGFERPRRLEAPAPSPLILATRAGG